MQSGTAKCFLIFVTMLYKDEVEHFETSIYCLGFQLILVTSSFFSLAGRFKFSLELLLAYYNSLNLKQNGYSVVFGFIVFTISSQQQLRNFCHCSFKWKSKTRVTSYEFKSTIYEFKLTSYEFKSMGQKTKSTSCKIKSRSWEIKSTSQEIKSMS